MHEAAAPGAIYTCPMHPEIRQVGPGSCPICGMALEPVEVTAEAAPNPELIDMTRRFWIGLVLAIPVFVLEMGGHIPGLGLHHRDRAPHFDLVATASWRRRSFCGRAPFFAARLGLFGQPQAQHVHADRARHRHRVALQHGGRAGAQRVSGRFQKCGRLGAGLFRGGGSHHRARAAGPGAGTAGARADGRRYPGAAQSRAQDSPPHSAGRQR